MNQNLYDWNNEVYDWEKEIHETVFVPEIIEPGIVHAEKKVETTERDLPEVSFGLDVGKKYQDSVVNFDYDQYFSLAEQIGMTEEEASAQKIKITNKTSKIGALNFMFSGAYSPVTKETVVRARSSTNWILAHELQHAHDDLRGKLGSTSRTIAGNIAGLFIMPVSALLIASNVNSILDENGSAMIEGYASEISKLYIATFLAYVGLYYLSPTEIRARLSSINNRKEVFYVSRGN